MNQSLPMSSKAGHTIATYTQNFLSPSKNSPPIDRTLATTERMTNNVTTWLKSHDILLWKAPPKSKCTYL
ncbi:hypothetical protein BU25DRAFT_58603 [Macroventuria anomochaeta]|uniref:Uncharacterized protein n=1 Tax=Macroventuria anomochaeta TaxID=301207 RepID=A0ACB6S0X9_9PLEO|nr:uncharacterized protein BU25DRAFT_58603 [Macroventuria anomochaeta]KAF2627694.1 hypothetical protein BU25DRAFT_58603 [Macroventuria anomochaeta]